MAKNAMVRARIRPDLKRKAERVFSRLGLTASQAIEIFYSQAELRKGLPFDVVVPNAATLKTFADTDAGRDLVVCKNVVDMFRKLARKR